MMLDNGGVETVTPEASAALGLEVEVTAPHWAVGGCYRRRVHPRKEMRLGTPHYGPDPTCVTLPRFLTDRGAATACRVRRLRIACAVCSAARL